MIRRVFPCCRGLRSVSTVRRVRVAVLARGRPQRNDRAQPEHAGIAGVGQLAHQRLRNRNPDGPDERTPVPDDVARDTRRTPRRHRGITYGPRSTSTYLRPSTMSRSRGPTIRGCRAAQLRTDLGRSWTAGRRSDSRTGGSISLGPKRRSASPGIWKAPSRRESGQRMRSVHCCFENRPDLPISRSDCGSGTTPYPNLSAAQSNSSQGVPERPCRATHARQGIVYRRAAARVTWHRGPYRSSVIHITAMKMLCHDYGPVWV